MNSRIHVSQTPMRTHTRKFLLTVVAGLLLWADVRHIPTLSVDGQPRSGLKSKNGRATVRVQSEAAAYNKFRKTGPHGHAPPKTSVRKRAFADAISAPSYPGISERLRVEALSAHDSEPRDATWAPAMETAFGLRITAEELAKYGLVDLRITELSCKRVTCRLAYEYPARVEDVLAANGLPRDTSPLALIEEQTGPPAPLNLGWSQEHFVRDGQRVVRMVAVFGFDENSYDPDLYDEWVESQLERTREAFGRMPRQWSASKHSEGTDLMDAG